METSAIKENFNIDFENETKKKRRINLNSTALDDTTNAANEITGRDLTLSPIPRADSPDNESSDDIGCCAGSSADESPAREPGDITAASSHGTSTPERRTHRVPLTRRQNPFERHLATKLLSNTVSPSLFQTSAAANGSPEGASDFSWSIEHLALLNPADITDEDVANSAHSPDPVLEAHLREVADVYWKSGILYIPSPEGPRPVMVETPLAESARLRAAQLAAAAGSMSKAKPTSASPVKRVSSFRTAGPSRKRHCATQTTCTISPQIDFDFSSIFGDSSVFEDNPVEVGDEFDANVSVSSLRRRLFAADDSFLSDGHGSANCSQLMMNCSNGGESPPRSTTSPPLSSSGSPSGHDHRADLDGAPAPVMPHLEFSMISPIHSDSES